MQPCVYILASKRNGTLYVGLTTDLIRRVYQHRTKQLKGFTAQYDVTRLVWYEVCPDLEAARIREKRLKRWRRAWKLALIEKENPQWRDLWEDLTGERPEHSPLGPG
jgi:putative endonuclease